MLDDKTSQIAAATSTLTARREALRTAETKLRQLAVC